MGALPSRAEQVAKLKPRRRSVMLYVHRNETADFGVIIDPRISHMFIKRGWMIRGERRKFARDSGACVRLTDEGYCVARMIEGYCVARMIEGDLV